MYFYIIFISVTPNEYAKSRIAVCCCDVLYNDDTNKFTLMLFSVAFNIVEHGIVPVKLPRSMHHTALSLNKPISVAIVPAKLFVSDMTSFNKNEVEN